LEDELKQVLIIGEIGMPGKPVAQNLRAGGFNVRLLASNPEHKLVLARHLHPVRKPFRLHLTSFSPAQFQ